MDWTIQMPLKAQVTSNNMDIRLLGQGNTHIGYHNYFYFFHFIHITVKIKFSLTKLDAFIYLGDNDPLSYITVARWSSVLKQPKVNSIYL